MKTLVDPEDYESVLAQWRGAQAKIWVFHVTHNRLAIGLLRDDLQDVLYVVAVGCEHIAGPFAWQGANVEIVVKQADELDQVRYSIFDRGANFNLLCCGVALARGPAGIPDSPFEHFLGG